MVVMDAADPAPGFQPEASTEQPVMTPYGARYVAPRGLKQKATAVTRDGLRRYGQATAALRMLPDYLVIGTKRGGTTSMARWLLEHPDVRPLFPARETRKGTYYFDVNYERGENWYRSHFPTRLAHGVRTKAAGRPLLIGEATPYYLHHPHAPVRARRTVPNAKVIALLRDPVARAHSHWVERTRNGVETLPFDQAIEAEATRLNGEEAKMLNDPSYVSFSHQHFSYVDQGRYARGLRRWAELFPQQQLLVIRSEDLYVDPTATYGQVLDFLGLPLHQLAEFEAWNRKPKDAVDPQLSDHLRQLLAPDIAEVEKIVGRALDWD